MEYLPNGALCIGSVTQVYGSSFRATCHLSDGAVRYIEATGRRASAGT